MFGVIGAEELHWGCAGIALAISGSGLAAAGLAASGTPEQIARWVPECFGVGDEIKLGAYAVTEAGAGSDVKSLRTTARRDGDEWVLNGTKVFITNGGIADVHVVVANVAPELGHRGQASFVVEKGTPGHEPGQEGVEARHPRLAHRRGRASRTAGSRSRTCSAGWRSSSASSSGRARGESSAAARTRSRPSSSPGRSSAPRRSASPRPPTSGRSSTSTTRTSQPTWSSSRSTRARPPGGRRSSARRNQQILAQVATEIEAARLLVQRAAWMGRNGIPLTAGQGSMSKLKSGQVAVWTTRTMIDLVGPYATTSECPLEKWFRDAKIYELFEGTAEIQRLVISRMQVTEYRDRLLEAAAIAAEAHRARLTLGRGSVAAAQ